MAVGSTIICHNGAVYRLKKLKSIENINDLVNATYTDVKNKYLNWTKPMIENYVSDILIERLNERQILSYSKK